MKFSRFAVFLCAWGLVALPGCGAGPAVGPCVPVRGKVTLGGKPLVGGSVTLIPLEGEGNRPRPEGTIDTQGMYSVRTAGKEGAPPGKYRATLTTGGEDKAQEALFDPRYSHWEKSPLIIQVSENPPAGAYDLPLEPLRGR
jgi:hypothetical protein